MTGPESFNVCVGVSLCRKREECFPMGINLRKLDSSSFIFSEEWHFFLNTLFLFNKSIYYSFHIYELLQAAHWVLMIQPMLLLYVLLVWWAYIALPAANWIQYMCLEVSEQDHDWLYSHSLVQLTHCLPVACMESIIWQMVWLCLLAWLPFFFSITFCHPPSPRPHPECGTDAASGA